MNDKTITFKEHLASLTKAAHILLAEKYYIKGLDLWDIINGAWLVMVENNAIEKLVDRDQKYALLTACINAGRTYLNRLYKLKRTRYRSDLSLLDVSLDTENGYTFDKQDDSPTAEDCSSNAELFQHVMGVARKVLTVTEYRTIELYYLHGLIQADVTDVLGLRSRGGTSDRIKLAIQKIRNELSVTGNLLETL